MRRLTLSISEPLAGRQVRTLLRRELGLSAAGVRRAKDQPDGILLDGQPVFTNVFVQPGQVLSVAVGDVTGSDQIAPVPGPLALCYEDEDLLIVNKPGDLAVHPSLGHHGDTLANFLMAHYEAQHLTAAFHPVNRLDRGTSGLMAVAKHAHAHELLQRQLQTTCRIEIPEMYSHSFHETSAAQSGAKWPSAGFHLKTGGPPGRGRGPHPLRSSTHRSGAKPGAAGLRNRPHPSDPGPHGLLRLSSGRRFSLRPRAAGAAPALRPALGLHPAPPAHHGGRDCLDLSPPRRTQCFTEPIGDEFS